MRCPLYLSICAHAAKCTGVHLTWARRRHARRAFIENLAAQRALGPIHYACAHMLCAFVCALRAENNGHANARAFTRA